MLSIQNLSSLSTQEKQKILYRSTLNIQEILQNTVTPMAEAMKQNTLEKLKEYTLKFDKTLPQPFLLMREDLKKAFNKIYREKPEVIQAFEKAYQNIYDFHKKQIPKGFECEVAQNRLGYRFVPFDRVALYVPGGVALYPSTVLMGITPAAIAGVENILLLSPPSQNGQVHEIVQAVAYLAGANSILQAGGAQAILAAAYGLPEFEISAADYIYGPGNIYVAVAKNYVLSQNLCGIDGFAGPSEVVIIADNSANPNYLANDLLAQAEHDANAMAILLITDENIAKQTLVKIGKAIEARPERKEITLASMQRNGKILLCQDLEQAIDFSNEFAPEHLEIQTEENEKVLAKIKAAGSIFVGDYAPVALGDYFSGTNHILPTNGAARFCSGVSTQSFYRRITWQVATQEGLQLAKEPITLMSKEEGLFNEHGYSVLTRFEK